jgi:hypothetical protein
MMKLLARFLARPVIAAWLIRRAMRAPYFHITSADGCDIYMERYWLFNPYPANSDGAGRRWGDWLPSVRIHCIRREDQDRHMHDHPWNARTFILRGWYEEVRQIRPYVGQGHFICFNVLHRRLAADTAKLRFGEYHRITAVAPDGVWTMFVTWRKLGTWGFLVDGRKVPWREYLDVEKEAA